MDAGGRLTMLALTLTSASSGPRPGPEGGADDPDARRPLTVDLDRVSAGRTFTTYATRVSQAGRCCATGTVLLDTTAPTVMRHAAAPPDVAAPHESVPVDMSVTGRDIRVVDDLPPPVAPSPRA